MRNLLKGIIVLFIAIGAGRAQGQTLTTIAGGGAADGLSSTSTIYPQGIGLDAAGNIYFADSKRNRIRKLDAVTGMVTTVAGRAVFGAYIDNQSLFGDGGQATAALLYNPQGIFVDGAGNIYIADMSNNRIRKVTAATGIISTVAGTGTTTGFSGDGGQATAAQLNSPTGVACDAAGNIYILDAGNKRIRKVTLATGIITTIAGNGTSANTGDGGLATAASISSSNGLCLDATGNIYFSAPGRVRKITVSSGLISTYAGTGTVASSGDGGLATAATTNPWGVTIDAAGNLYISESGSARIRKVTVADGKINTIAGTGVAGFSGDGGLATAAQVRGPYATAIDPSGNIYIADGSNIRIRKITVADGIINTIAGTGTPLLFNYTGDGDQATNAELYGPTDVASDAAGNIYIAEADNNRIRKVAAATGIITTIAGTGTLSSTGNGGLATAAAVAYPTVVKLDAAGNIYISETGTASGIVRKINISTGIITKIAGNGGAYSGDGGLATAAGLANVSGMCIDVSGNIYLVCNDSRVRKITASTGIITTIAGTGTSGYSGDGGLATAARLNNPYGVAVDAAGNVYISDNGNKRIRKITVSTGIINTIAGTGASSVTHFGDNGPATSAQFYYLTGLVFDATGNLYVLDGLYVRKITISTGIISTFAGSNAVFTSQFNGDNLPALTAQFFGLGLTIDPSGNIIIADNDNQRIRKVTQPAPTITSILPSGGPVGTLVTVSGTALGYVTALSIGGATATIVSNNGSDLVAMVMPGAATGAVALSTISGAANGPYNFIVTQADYPSVQDNKLSSIVATTAGDGQAVAMNADGSAMVSGAPQSNTGFGNGWVYTRNSNGLWQGNIKLEGTGNIGAANQGQSVAISADGLTVAVGGPGDNTNAGAVWIFTRPNNLSLIWTQQAKLTATGATGAAGLGWSLAISANGNTVVSGGYTDNSNIGATWVFTRTGTNWAQQGNKLVGTGVAGVTSQQGWAVAISADGKTILSGGNADNTAVGAAWVFTQTAGVWAQEGTKLTGTGSTGASQQGSSVSLSADGNTAMVGGLADNSNQGGVWVYTRSAGTWTQQSKLTITGNTGAAKLGQSVSLNADGNIAVIGGDADNSNKGAAWVFKRTSGTWTQQGSKLVSASVTSTNNQGKSVAISADGLVMVVGAPSDLSLKGTITIYKAIHAPVVYSFNPVSGGINASVLINGSTFNTTALNNIVYFGSTKATIVNGSSSSLTVTVPAGATYQPISVTDGITHLTGYSPKPFVVTTIGVGTTTFLTKTDVTTTNPGQSVVIADLDGDGKTDIIDATNGPISIFRNITASGDAPAFATKIDLTPGAIPKSVITGDIDGDGKTDIIVCKSDNTVSVFRNTSTSGTISFAAKVDFATGTGAMQLAIGDIDGDGKPDLAITNETANTLSILQNTSTLGTINFAAKQDFVTAAGPYGIAIGDMDGDKKPDIVITNYTGNSASVFRNISASGTIAFASRLNLTTGNGPTSVAIGDLDLDGKPDLLIANTLSSTLSAILNFSTPGILSFGSKTDGPTGPGSFPHSVALSDFDGDGKVDVAFTHGTSTYTTVTVAFNLSTPGNIVVGPLREFNAGTQPYAVALGDLDGDGRSDISVVGAYNSVSVLRNALTMDPPIITMDGPTTFCAGDSTRMISSVATGNQWYKDGTIINGATAVSYTAKLNGVYTDIITNSYGVTAQSAAMTITVNPLPAVPVITLSRPATMCSGDTLIFTSSAAVNQWYKGDLLLTGATASTYTARTAGTYKSIVTNSSGCTSSSTITTVIVNAVPPVPVSTAKIPTVFCTGDSAILSSSAATGNQWYKDSVLISGAVFPLFTTKDPGVYALIVTNQNGCSATAVNRWRVTVNSYPAIPVITTSGPTTFNTGDSLVLTSSASTGNQWYKDGLAIIDATTSSYSAKTGGVYSSIVTSAEGCQTASASVAATLNNLTITKSKATTFCVGDSVILASSVAAGNQWYKDGVLISGATAQSYTARQAGVYTDSVSADNFKLGSASTTVVVNASPAAPVLTTSGPVGLCAGSSVTITSSVSAGNKWYKNGVLITGADNVAYTANTPGIYVDSLTGTNGCKINSAAVTVTVNDLPAVPAITAGGPVSFCTGSSVTLTSSAASGNKWYKNGDLITGAESASYNINTPGIYVDSVTNANGCKVASAVTTVTVNPYPVLTAITAPTSMCAGTTAQLRNTATGGVWSSSNTTVATVNTAGVLSAKAAGTAIANYAVTTAGCTTSISTTVMIETTPLTTKPLLTEFATDTLLCFTTQVTLTSKNTFDKYLWSTGETTPSITVKANAKISLKVGSATASCYTADSSVIVDARLNTTPAPLITRTADLLSSTTSNDYRWFLNSKLLSTQSVPSVAITVRGFYRVETSLDKVCYTKSAEYFVASDPVTVKNAFDVLVYPNPSTTGNFKADVSFAKLTSASVSVMVVDGSGSTKFALKRYMFSSNIIKIPITQALPKGTYTLRVEVNGEVVTKQVIVQ